MLRGEGGGDNKIAGFLSRLCKCKEFSHHNSYKYTADGQSLGESDKDDEQEEFKTFLQEAMDNATEVTKTKADAIQAVASLTKRNQKSDKLKVKPLNKQERIEKYYYKEVTDPKGVEKEHVKNYKGRADIHLDNLVVCSRVLVPIDPMKVKVLAKEMHEMFDPSACILTAVPCDDSEFDGQNLKANSYEIVHGRHRYVKLDVWYISWIFRAICIALK